MLLPDIMIKKIMNNMRKIIEALTPSVCGCMLLFLCVSSLHAKAREDGGQPGAYLSWGAGARALGMGRAYVGLSDDASAPFWNPAGLGQIRNTEFGTLYSFLWEDTSYGYISFVHPLIFRRSTTRPGVIGISMVNLTSTNFKKTDQYNNMLGTASDVETAGLISFGKEIYPYLYTGLNIKIVNQKIDGYSDTGIGADVGVLYKPIVGYSLVDNRLSLGFSMLNLIEPKIRLKKKTDIFPLEIKTGIAYAVIPENLKIVIDADKNKNRSLKFHYGIEYAPYKLLAFRAGINETELTGGIGINIKDFTINYAYAYHNALEKDLSLGSSHRIGLNIKFSKDSGNMDYISKEQILKHVKNYEKGVKDSYKESRVAAKFSKGAEEYHFGNYEKSYKLFEQISQQSQNPVFLAEALVGMAESAYMLNNIKHTEKHLKKLKNLAPAYQNDIRVKVLNSKLYLSWGDMSKALEAIVGENTDEAVWTRVKIYREYNKLALALGEIRNHFELFPQSLRSKERQIVLAEILYASGEYEKAIAEFNVFISAYPDHDKALYCRYMISSAQLLQDKYMEAYKGFSYISDHASDRELAQKALFLKAESAWLAGRSEEAKKLYMEVAEKSNDQELVNDAHYKLCLVLLKENEIDKLEKKCGRIAGKDVHARFTSLLGLAMLEKAESDQAGTYFIRALEQSTDITDIDRNLVLLSLVGSPAHIRSLIEQKPLSSSWARYVAIFVVADGLFDSGLYKEAEKLFNKIATGAEEPHLRVLAELRYADCLMQDKRYEKAVRHLSRIEENSSYLSTPEITLGLWMGLGHLNYKMKNYTKAGQYYDRIIKTFPDNIKSAQGYYYRGKTYSINGEYSPATAVWISMAQQFPSLQEANQALSDAIDLSFSTREYEDIIRVTGVISELYPGTKLEFKSRMLSAKSSYNQKKYADAIQIYQDLLAETTMQARIETIERDLSVAYYQIGLKAPNGEEMLDEFALIYPNRRLIGEVYWQIGAEHFDAKNYKEAEKRLYKVVMEYPHSTSANHALFYLAESIYWQVRTQDSIPYYMRFIASYPNDILAGTARFRLANAYFRIGRIPASIELYKNILESNPNPDVKKNSMMNLAMGYYRINDIENAVQAFRAIISKFPGTTEANTTTYQLARILMDEGRLDEAIKLYKRVRPTKEITAMEVTYRIGQAYLKKDMIDHAIKTFYKLMSMKARDNTHKLRGLIELADLLEKRKKYDDVIKIYKVLKKSTGDKKTRKLIDSKLKELIKKRSGKLTRR